MGQFFSILRTNWAILTSYIRAASRTFRGFLSVCCHVAWSKMVRVARFLADFSQRWQGRRQRRRTRALLCTFLLWVKGHCEFFRVENFLNLIFWFLREKHDQRNPEDIEAAELNEYLCEFILSVTRKDGKDFEPARLKVCFQVLIDIWKNAIISSVSSKTLLLHALEAKNKQLMYRSLPKPPMPPPPQGKPRGMWLFWKILVKFPAILLVRRSNAPPAWASKRVKSPTLQAC